MKLESILVAVDFSPLSVAAAERACALAGEKGVVRLLHVVSTELLPHHGFLGRDLVEKFYDGLAAEAEIGLATMAERLRGSGPRIEREIVRGSPGDEIVGAAARGHDLVVVGAHARDMAQRLVLGSVAEKVSRTSPVPTLIVRESAEGRRRVRRVLLALDVTEPFDEAIEAADSLAERTGAKLEAVHVVPLPTRLPGLRLRALAAARKDLEARVRSHAPREIKKAVSRAIGRSAAVHVAVGSPAREIASYARPDDVIVCGTHARGALGRIAFGSVAVKLARTAPCPVLVVQPRQTKAKGGARSEAQAAAR